MSQHVEGRLKASIPDAFRGEPVLFAYLYGSHARGDTHPRSDVDVAVYLDPSVPATAHLGQALAIAGQVERSAGIGPVEVLVLNSAPLPVVGRVIEERVVIYSRDEPARVEFESVRHRQFLDFEIHARPLAEALLRRVARS